MNYDNYLTLVNRSILYSNTLPFYSYRSTRYTTAKTLNISIRKNLAQMDTSWTPQSILILYVLSDNQNFENTLGYYLLEKIPQLKPFCHSRHAYVSLHTKYIFMAKVKYEIAIIFQWKKTGLGTNCLQSVSNRFDGLLYLQLVASFFIQPTSSSEVY